ncbi:aminotransferase family protein [Streptomyces sp. NY05-11A]|uniref:aminotransferase family protein n=1 Tax=Streptomyces soliscabiei TaxID=588897 RepID=UPI0029B71DF7|nr:aminotransferase class III-fold pyridoxal phosphate-dependent enzyme [Streptomyces sp. NY05-11A]MDX2680600.1 aminotransferase class III-fold pyridoxal phosphate-dependent enzyme [Streptomyces sp. NY05-11A]
MSLPLPADELVTADRNHLLHPFLPGNAPGRVVMVRGEGCRLYDAEGRSYLDATAGMWLCQIGHGRTEPVEAAHRQLSRLAYTSSFWEFSNDTTIALARRLARISPPGVQRALFTTGGSEGNELALRMARLYHHRTGSPRRTWILSRSTAYHGAGYGAGGVSGFPELATGTGPQLPHVAHLTAPDPYRFGPDAEERLTDHCLTELEQVIGRIGPGNIAAMIGEPVMALAGMVAPPPDYWPRVSALLRHHGILLILDEVVTAWGRLGAWFAGPVMGAVADITVTSKGLTSGYFPLGAVLPTERIADVLLGDGGFPAGHTYCGHPVGCAVALANLDVIERDQLLGAADDLGPYLDKALAPLADLPIVGEVRRTGLMCAVDLVADRATRASLPNGTYALADAVRARTGVLVRGGPHALTFTPPLVMSRAEGDELARALADVLHSAHADGTHG